MKGLVYQEFLRSRKALIFGTIGAIAVASLSAGLADCTVIPETNARSGSATVLMMLKKPS